MRVCYNKTIETKAKRKAEEATKMDALPKASKSDETETEEEATNRRHSDVEPAYRLLMNGSFSPVGTPMKDCRKAPPNNDGRTTF